MSVSLLHASTCSVLYKLDHSTSSVLISTNSKWVYNVQTVLCKTTATVLCPLRSVRFDFMRIRKLNRQEKQNVCERQVSEWYNLIIIQIMLNKMKMVIIQIYNAYLTLNRQCQCPKGTTFEEHPVHPCSLINTLICFLNDVSRSYNKLKSF